MCTVIDFHTFRHLADVEDTPLSSVTIAAVNLNPDSAGAEYGIAFSSEHGYDTILWVGNYVFRKRRPCHVWYEASFDNDGDLVAISTFVRSEALDSRTSSLRTLVANVRALTGLAHLRFEACGKGAGSYTVSGCSQPIIELVDLLRL